MRGDRPELLRPFTRTRSGTEIFRSIVEERGRLDLAQLPSREKRTSRYGPVRRAVDDSRERHGELRDAVRMARRQSGLAAPSATIAAR